MMAFVNHTKVPLFSAGPRGCTASGYRIFMYNNNKLTTIILTIEALSWDAVAFSTAICVVGIRSEMSATPGLSTTEPWDKVSGVSPPWMDRRRHQHRACERGLGQQVSDKFYHRRWELAPANREGSHRRFTSEAAEARNRRDDGQGLGSGNAREKPAVHLATGKSAPRAST